MSTPTDPRKQGDLPRRRRPLDLPPPPARQKPPSTSRTAGPGSPGSVPSSKPALIRRRPSPAPVSDMTEDRTDSYEVGYGKPPKSSQFKKGEIPNPYGRRGKSRGKDDDTLLAAILAELDQSVAVTEGSKSRRMRKIRVLAKSLINKALKGDNPATKTLIGLLSNAGLRRAGDAPPEPEQAELSVADPDILEQFRLQCIEAHLKSKGPAI